MVAKRVGRGSFGDESPLDSLPGPPSDTWDIYVELEEEDLHFLDAIIQGYDGLANVRREYRAPDGYREFRIMVSPEFLQETIRLLRELRRYIFIGKIKVRRGEG